MKAQSLAAAFQATVTRRTPNTAPGSVAARDGWLMAALQRSATGLDQIVQRRVGLQGWEAMKS